MVRYHSYLNGGCILVLYPLCKYLCNLQILFRKDVKYTRTKQTCLSTNTRPVQSKSIFHMYLEPTPSRSSRYWRQNKYIVSRTGYLFWIECHLFSLTTLLPACFGRFHSDMSQIVFVTYKTSTGELNKK